MEGHDNLEEFRDPETYDRENGGFEHGGPFYEQLAYRTGGPILELACGTGRVTIPLVRRGFDVTGLDIMPEMLQYAQKKAEAARVTVKWVEGDCSEFSLGTKFRFIFMTGNAFQAFLDDTTQKRVLKCVFDHLSDDGLFAFEVRNLKLELQRRTTNEEEEWGVFQSPDGETTRVSETRWFDEVRQVEHYTTFRRTYRGETLTSTSVTRIAIRYWAIDQLRSLLAGAGFEIAHEYGDFERNPWQPTSPQIVLVCRKSAN